MILRDLNNKINDIEHRYHSLFIQNKRTEEYRIWYYSSTFFRGLLLILYYFLVLIVKLFFNFYYVIYLINQDRDLLFYIPILLLFQKAAEDYKAKFKKQARRRNNPIKF